MKIAFIGVPIAQGADREGVDMAPDFFRQQGVIKMLDDISGCCDFGNILSSIIDEGRHEVNPDVKYLDTVVDIDSQLRDKVYSVVSQGYFPLIVGGDHSLGLGSVAGVSLTADNIAVIWFDAHGDFNTEFTSPSGNLHGMPCAALMGWCTSSLKNVIDKPIPSCNFFWIGTRSLDDGEVKYMDDNRLNIYTASAVREHGMGVVMSEVIAKIDKLGIDKIHLSIDIDAMDPTIVCGTGTREDGGMLNGDFYSLLDLVFETKKVQSIDFVEYNRLLDDKNLTTAKWCAEALHYLSVKIKQL